MKPPKSFEEVGEFLRGMSPAEIDSAEVEGGLTWRQDTLLGVTAGYLAYDPSDDSPLNKDRLRIKASAYIAIREVFRNRQPSDVFDFIVTSIDLTILEYEKRLAEQPELEVELGLLRTVRECWLDRPYFVTDELARQVLWYVPYSGEIIESTDPPFRQPSEI